MVCKCSGVTPHLPDACNLRSFFGVVSNDLNTDYISTGSLPNTTDLVVDFCFFDCRRCFLKLFAYGRVTSKGGAALKSKGLAGSISVSKNQFSTHTKTILKWFLLEAGSLLVTASDMIALTSTSAFVETPLSSGSSKAAATVINGLDLKNKQSENEIKSGLPTPKYRRRCCFHM